MKPEELEEYNAMVDILNVIQEMFSDLDDYRKLHREKKQGAEFKLWNAHGQENKARKMINQLLEKQESKTQTKTRAA